MLKYDEWKEMVLELMTPVTSLSPHAWAGMQLAKVLLTLTPKPVADIMNN